MLDFFGGRGGDVAISPGSGAFVAQPVGEVKAELDYESTGSEPMSKHRAHKHPFIVPETWARPPTRGKRWRQFALNLW